MRVRCHIPLDDLPSAGLILEGLDDLASDRITPASLLIRAARKRLQGSGILEEMPPLIPLEREPSSMLHEMLAGAGQLALEPVLMANLREFLRAAEARHAAYLREVSRLPVTASALQRIEADYPPARQRMAAFVMEILHDQVGLRVSAIQPDSRFSDDLDITPLEFVELIMALKETLQLEIPDSDCSPLDTVRDLVNYLCRRLGERVAGGLSEAA